MEQTQLNWITNYIWRIADKFKIRYEISFTRYLYKPLPMRNLEGLRGESIGGKA